MRFVRTWLAPLSLVLVSTAIGLAIVERGVRLAYLRDPRSVNNLAIDLINRQVTNNAVRYDPVIGYISRPGYRDGTHSNGRMGVRLNRMLKADEGSPPIPHGGIFAAGDSFTHGSEVSDHESWPAQLEAMPGIPVVNGGAGGYGVNQALLRAEQLLDVAKPRLVNVPFIPGNVGRSC